MFHEESVSNKTNPLENLIIVYPDDRIQYMDEEEEEEDTYEEDPYEEDFYEDDQQSLNSVTSADSRASSSSVSIKCMYVLHSVLAMTTQFCF